MKKCLVLSLYLIIQSSCILSFAQPVNITFKATVKTSDDKIIPGAYIKVYPPDETVAVDSMFANELGKIEKVLPFTFDSNPSSVKLNQVSGYIINEIRPNVIGPQNHSLYLEYSYPDDAELIFLDTRGRLYRDGAILSG